jgi:hypothetical protein
VPAGALLAGVVEQTLTYVLPDGLFPVQSCGVGLLDFDGAAAAAAGDPQQVPLNVGKPLRPDGRTGRCAFTFNFIQHRPPILRRQLVGRADGRRRVSAGGGRNGLFLHLFSGRHAPACGSVGHVMIRT